MGSAMGGESLSYVEAGPPVMKSAYGGGGHGSDLFTSNASNDPFAPMGQPKKASGVSALKWDPRTGKLQSGTDIGEEPLPGNRMSDEECKRHGLPKGTLWLDEEAAKAVPHPLFDPGRKNISWDELPTGLSEAMASSGLAPRSQLQYNEYGQIPESDSQPRALNLGDNK